MAACPEAGQLGALTPLRPGLVRRQSPSLEPGASQEAGGAALRHAHGPGFLCVWL